MLKLMIKRNNITKSILVLLCIISILIMFYLVFTPHFLLHLHVQSGPQPENVVIGSAPVAFFPFQEITNIGFWLNIVMTMPVGGLILLLKSARVRFIILWMYGLLLGIFIESMQFILDNSIKRFSRFVDINDVISNMLGVVLGFYLLLVVINLINVLSRNK